MCTRVTLAFIDLHPQSKLHKYIWHNSRTNAKDRNSVDADDPCLYPLDLRIQHQSNIIMRCFCKLSIVNILPPMSRSSIDTSPLLIRVKRWVWLWVQNSLAECVIYQLKKERRLVVVGGFRWAVDLDILGSILTWSSPRLLDTQFWWVGLCIR